MIHHALPPRVDVAILLILLTVASLLAVAIRVRRQARRRPTHIKVDLVGGVRSPDRRS